MLLYIIVNLYISGINYAIRSSFYLLLLILDNIVSSDRVNLYIIHIRNRRILIKLILIILDQLSLLDIFLDLL